jgi:hypothetical protein
MGMDEQTLINEIFADLSAEIGDLSEGDQARLSSKIKGALREVKMKRCYPSDFSEETIMKDLIDHYVNIRALALYYFNQIGVEGQKTHNENGVNRTWKNRNECLIGVFAYCG